MVYVAYPFPCDVWAQELEWNAGCDAPKENDTLKHASDALEGSSTISPPSPLDFCDAFHRVANRWPDAVYGPSPTVTNTNSTRNTRVWHVWQHSQYRQHCMATLSVPAILCTVWHDRPRTPSITACPPITLSSSPNGIEYSECGNDIQVRNRDMRAEGIKGVV